MIAISKCLVSFILLTKLFALARVYTVTHLWVNIMAVSGINHGNAKSINRT